MNQHVRIQPATIALHKQIEAKLIEEFGEDNDAIPDTLDGLTDLGDQIQAVLQTVCEQEAFAKALDGEIARLKARKKRLVRSAQIGRQVAAEAALEAGTKKLSRPDMTVTFGLTEPGLDGDADPATLHDEFVRVKREINRTAIKEALDAGRDVPGFRLTNGRPTLTMRRA